MYHRLSILASFFGIGIFVVNGCANVFYWYVSIPWFDMVMHTLGGVFVAILGGALFVRQIKVLPPKALFVILMLFVFIVGLSWEYYEYVIQFYIRSVHLADVSDSISDLICDMVGGSVGSYFVIILNKRYNKE